MPFSRIAPLFVCFVGLLAGCSGAGRSMSTVPENGYENTLNYQVQAQVFSDDEGKCTRVTVKVRPQNKLYGENMPPSRLQLIDDDCLPPIHFERIEYTDRNSGDFVRLSGPEIAQFWSRFYNMESEITQWLWQEGVGG